MSATSVVSQLRTILEKAEQLIPKLGKVYPAEEQWDVLGELSVKLGTTAAKIGDKIRVMKESRAHRAWKESEKLRSQASSCVGDLLANGRLKQPAVFRRNIITIFEGPKDSKFDSEDMKLRKVATRQRCEQIRGLSSDGVVSWATAFAPTLWAGGSTGSDILTCLLDNIEPELRLSWPPVVQETLKLLLEDEEALQRCPQYQAFLDG